VADQQVRCILAFDGRLDADRLRQAVALSLVAVPELRCRYVERWWRPQWRAASELDHDAIFKVREAGDVAEELQRVIAGGIDPLIGPQALISLLRGGSDILCINMNHMVADAAGLKDYSYLLAGLYAQLVASPHRGPRPGRRGSRSLTQVSRQLPVGARLRLARRALAKPAAGASWGLCLAGGTESLPCVATLHLPPGRFRQIQDYGKEHGATANDVLLTAYYRALLPIIEPPPAALLEVSVPVDLRRYSSSTASATASPPPRHSDARPVDRPRSRKA
jgi:NRPS condensation-like uncharacterized protein